MIISWDTETHLIKPGCLTPRMVCSTMYDGEDTGIWLRDEGLSIVKGWLDNPEVELVAQNIFYDLGIVCAEDEEMIPLVFDAIEAGRLHDTKLRQQIIDNFYGRLKYVWDPEKEKFTGSRYDLGSLIWSHFKVNVFAKKGTDDKGNKLADAGDIWRLRYNELDGVPLDQWPKEAVDYAIDDSVWAYKIFMEQEKELAPEGPPQGWKHVAHAWALYLESIRGFRTDPDYTLGLEQELLEEMAGWKELAQEHGRFIRRGKKESKNLKKIREAVAERVEHPLLTNKGAIATTREQLRNIPCPECGEGFDSHLIEGELVPCVEDDDHIGLWATSEVTRVEKKLNTYIKVLKRGFEVAINPRYNSIIETFRTSSSGPNIQNYPRQGNIRDCVIPRDGWLFGFCDYDTLEMRTLAQTCVDWFGFSDIADAIAAGEDLHVSLAAAIRGESYEDCYELFKAGDKAIKNERQFCKIGNYGLAGGMGASTLIDYARTGYDIIISPEKAQELYQGFRERWSEMPLYFNHIHELIDSGKKHIPHQVYNRSGLVRGRVNYTAGCNGNFQHLAAMGAKDANYRVARECYVEKDSPLYGCRPWLFAHDEIGLELPFYAIGYEGCSAAMARLREVMVESMKFWCPDVEIGATGAMCRRWMKGAEPVFVDGILVPSRREGKVWVPDLENERAAA